jgi:hypothetical protein
MADCSCCARVLGLSDDPVITGFGSEQGAMSNCMHSSSPRHARDYASCQLSQPGGH